MSSTAANILEFLQLVGKLKHLKRTGWVLRNIEDPETIAGHMYRMGVMTFLLQGDANVDKTRCLKLSIIHDLAECIVGDITPFCGIDPDEKHRKEDEAMKELARLAGASGGEIYDIYKEYEAQSTAEAKLVKELDNLDMVIQAYEYEVKEGGSTRLQEFYDSTKNKFKHPFTVGLVEELMRLRSKTNSDQPSK